MPLLSECSLSNLVFLCQPVLPEFQKHSPMPWQLFTQSQESIREIFFCYYALPIFKKIVAKMIGWQCGTKEKKGKECVVELTQYPPKYLGQAFYSSGQLTQTTGLGNGKVHSKLSGDIKPYLIYSTIIFILSFPGSSYMTVI